MRRLLTLRLTTPGLKFLYVLAVWSAGLPIVSVIPSVPVLDEVIGGVFIAFGLVGFWYGTRVFRGRGEPVAPVREWWRWTAWPTASWWLAIFFAWGLIGFIIRMVELTRSEATMVAAVVGGGVLIAINGVVALGYLNSAIRLTARGIRKPRRERRVLLTPPRIG
jgi:hypothetical protein